ncbi:MAG: SRPBCC family protein [Myxococcales bacterium]
MFAGVIVEARIDVARTPEELFGFVADRYFENVRLWDHDLIEVTPLDDGVMRLGARAIELRRELAPKRGKRPMGRTLEVVVFDRPRELVVSGLDSHPAHETYRTRWRFDPLGTRTRVRLRHEIRLPFPFVLGTPVVLLRYRFDVRRRLQRLRDAVEGQPALSRDVVDH